MEVQQQQQAPFTAAVDGRKDTIPAEVKKHFFSDRVAPNLYKDYDVIGFDADHCIVKYNISEIVKFLVEIELEDFLSYGYPKEITEFNYDEEGQIQVCLNGSIFDIENGLVIKMAEGQEVIRAMRGFKALTTAEIQEVYGCPPIFRAYQWPNTTHLSTIKGSYWVFMTFFDTPKVAIVLKAVDLKERGLLPHKSYYDIAMDIRSMVYKNYIHYNEREVYKIANFGGFFPAIVKDPFRFIQPQPDLKVTLQKLKDSGKKLFLATNSHIEYSNLIMSSTLGDDWRSLFDVVCCYCRKPLFFWDQKPAPFYTYDPSSPNLKGKPLYEPEELKEGSLYTEGNSKLLEKFFKRVTGKSELRVAFFGDQYITDVYSSSTNEDWDGFAVVEELMLYDSSFGDGSDPQLIKYDQYWGKDAYFIDQVEEGKRPKRSYFISQLEECARYMLPLMKNIRHWMPEEDEKKL